MHSFCPSFCPQGSGGGGGVGVGVRQMHCLANVPEIEHFLANAMQVPYISITHCSLPVFSLLNCCQKEVLAKDPPPPPGKEHFLAYQREVCNRYSKVMPFFVSPKWVTDTFFSIQNQLFGVNIKQKIFEPILKRHRFCYRNCLV